MAESLRGQQPTDTGHLECLSSRQVGKVNLGVLGVGLWCWFLVRTLGGSTEKVKGLHLQWSSGATTSGKALEKGSWEPGQGNYGLQSLEGELDWLSFLLSLDAEGQ